MNVHLQARKCAFFNNFSIFLYNLGKHNGHCIDDD
jgi:hypothetical protein